MKNAGSHLFFVMPVVLVLALAADGDAKSKPEIIRHDVRLLQDKASVTVQWQSPNPVLWVHAIVGRGRKDAKVDEYDNKRNRDGYGGETTFLIDTPIGPHQGSVAFEIVVEDDLRQRSDPVSGNLPIVHGTARGKGDDLWGSEHISGPPPGATVGGVVDQLIGMAKGGTPSGQQGGQAIPGSGGAGISVELKNDGFSPGAGITPFGARAAGDEVAAVLGPVARPFRLAKVYFLCGGSVGTGTFTMKIYQENGTPSPGGLLFSETYMVQGSDQVFQEIDFSGMNITAPAGNIRISFQYKHSGMPAIAFDGDGTTAPGRNWVFQTGTWGEASTAGVKGDAIIRAVVVTQ